MARKNPPAEIGPREKLEQDKKAAHIAAEKAGRRNYYREDNMIHYEARDARGKQIDDDNDPLLARLKKGLR